MFATVYTDASSSKGSYGYAFYIKCDQGVHSGSGLAPEYCRDSNYAEMYCIVEAIKESIEVFPSISKILVVTDSQTAQKALWKGSKNPKYKYLVWDFRRLEKKVDKILIKWTKGHRTDDSDRAYLNNKCDKKSRDILKNYGTI
jgi:ribonuclease HI